MAKYAIYWLFKRWHFKSFVQGESHCVCACVCVWASECVSTHESTAKTIGTPSFLILKLFRVPRPHTLPHWSRNTHTNTHSLPSLSTTPPIAPSPPRSVWMRVGRGGDGGGGGRTLRWFESITWGDGKTVLRCPDWSLLKFISCGIGPEIRRLAGERGTYEGRRLSVCVCECVCVCWSGQVGYKEWEMSGSPTRINYLRFLLSSLPFLLTCGVPSFYSFILLLLHFSSPPLMWIHCSNLTFDHC